MTAHRTAIPPGQNELLESIERVQVEAFDGERSLAKLVLSVKSPQTKGPAAGHQSTTLAIWVEQRAAMKLLVDLSNFANAYGWPLQEVIGQPSGFQRQVHAEMRKPNKRDGE